MALPDDSLNGAIEVVLLDRSSRASDLSGARQDFDETGEASISFSLHPAGAKRFGDETRKNVGQRFAIVLDDRIVSAPTIQSPITGGSGRITGSLTIEEAEQMAVVLRSGALPAKLKVAERRVVDASLGADSIRAGVTASVVGVGLVALFMIAAYGLLGVFAVTALLCNMFMMIGVLSFFGDFDAARDRGHPADHGYGGRLQRADLRADLRGEAEWAVADHVGRGGL